MALALRARAILLVFEKFTRAYLFQIARTRNHVITYTNFNVRFFETNLSLVTHHVTVCLYVSHLVSHVSKPAATHLVSHSVS